MKEVILIGDSIRMGYQQFVQEALVGVANVSGPTQNGGTSTNVLTNVVDWVISHQADILHINCGLHDIKRPFDTGELNVPIEEYQANLESIFDRVLSETETRVIWAKTTPVNEKWHHERKGFDRIEADVDAYNLASVEIAERKGIPVNDLHKVIMDAGRDEQLVPDGVHFSEDGSRLLGEAVATFIPQML